MEGGGNVNLSASGVLGAATNICMEVMACPWLSQGSDGGFLGSELVMGALRKEAARFPPLVTSPVTCRMSSAKPSDYGHGKSLMWWPR